MRRPGLLICGAGLVTVVFLLSIVTGQPGQAAPLAPQPVTAPAQGLVLTLAAVSPGQAPNNMDTTLILTGTGFQAVLSGSQVLTGPAVRLDDAALPTVGWVNSTSLTATVPWGLDPGVYTATVTNPDGGHARLTRAFTVEQAIGVWTTGGPYGGDVNDLAVSPLLSTTAFAAIRNAGLYGTEDRGTSWQVLVPATGGIGGFAYTDVPTPQLYYWSEAQGLWHSDGSLAWEQIDQGYYISLAVDPQDAGHVWADTNNGLSQSTDGGATWQVRNNSLPAGIRFQVLAVHPADPSTVYAAASDGRLYRTTDAGLHWQHLDNGLPPASVSFFARALAIDPFDPDVVLYSRWMDPDTYAYRTTDGGDSWSPIVEPQGCGLIADLAFSPFLSGTVYASLAAENRLGISSDGGATWQCLGQRNGDFMISLGLDPISGLPAYLGAHSAGTFRRAGDLASWEQATDGIAGLPIMGLAASPANPDTVYVAAEHAGAYRSDDAGQSWRQLALDFPGAFGIAAHPTDRDRAYVASDWGVYYNPDGSDYWPLSTVPVTYHTFLYTLAIAPTDPSTVLVGGRDDTAGDENIGVAFLSGDGGASWAHIDVGRPISYPAEFAVDPSSGLTMYLATRGWGRNVPSAQGPGLGLFRSTDGGSTWQPIKSGLGDYPVSALAIRPDRPQTLFAGGVEPASWRGDVYRSPDGGDTWLPCGLPLDWSWVDDLAIDPAAPDTVYAATGEGLFYSTDGGDTWDRAPNEFGYLPVQHLSITSDSERTVLYAATAGGLPGAPTTARSRGRLISAGGYVQGGVYQLTIDHRPGSRIYLPLIVQAGPTG